MVSKFIEKYGDKALKRFLSDEEIKLVKKPATAAGFWAAKEAIAKALKTGIGSGLSFHDITIYKEKSGAPNFMLSSKITEKHQITDTSLSISHDGEYAVAVAVIEKINYTL